MLVKIKINEIYYDVTKAIDNCDYDAERFDKLHTMRNSLDFAISKGISTVTLSQEDIELILEV